MSALTTWLLSLGVPEWAVVAIASTLVVAGFGFALGIGAAIDEWLRNRRLRRSWQLPSDSMVLRPPAYRDMRGADPAPGQELPSLLRRQAE